MRADARADARCREGFVLMLATLCALGFVANEDKCDPPSTVQVFLGVGMDSVAMMFFFTADRLARIAQASLDLERSPQRVRVARIMSVLGHWMFMAQIVPGLGLYLRSGYSCIRGRERREFVSLTRAFRSDLAYLRRLVAGGTLTVSMIRKPLTSGFAAWDACTGWGMGAYLDGMWFAVPWADLMAGALGPVESFFPFQLPGTEHINYLELFAAYWFIRTWGARLRGLRLLCRTDNTATAAMLRRLWGQATFIPLLKEIFRLLVRFDMELEVHWIGTKDNLLADCLSRGAIGEFRQHAARFMSAPGVASDRDDWQLMPAVFAELDAWLGPFQVDACVDSFRVNSHCARSWTAEDRIACGSVGMGSPFSVTAPSPAFTTSWCTSCAAWGRSPLAPWPCSSSRCGSLPTSCPWCTASPTCSAWLRATPLARRCSLPRCPPTLGGGRRYVGPTRWPVIAVWAGPFPHARP